MTKYFFLAIMLRLTSLFGQDLQTQIKENAVEIEHLDKLDKSIFEKLDKFKLIMIGEMHGTNEPAIFLIGLTELFANYGDTVQVGFEIPSEQMRNYFQTLTDSSIFQSDFFVNNSVGLELRQVNNKPSIFSETLYFDNYLFLYQTVGIYNGIFFTKIVTASELTNKK
jgi:hypothetical protein